MRRNSNFPSRFLFDLETRIRGHFRFWKMSWQAAITTTKNEVIVCQGTSNSKTKNELKSYIFFYIMS